MEKSGLGDPFSEDLKTFSLLAAEWLEFHSSLSSCFPGTVLARCLVFPLIVKGQREAANIHNHLPEIQKFSARIREAKLTGNHTECESVAE